MSTVPPENTVGPVAGTSCHAMGCDALHAEFGHLRIRWCWFFSFGILLVICGTAAIVFPAITFITSLASMVVLGVCLMLSGLATIVTSLWAGKSSRMLVGLLVGILYIVAGFVITGTPLQSAVMMTAFIAAMFMVVGAFRTVAALVMRFPHWGWALLNGLVTFLCGAIIYRHFPQTAVWVIGLLIGLEMLFHGWAWIMLSLAIKNLPPKAV